LDGRPSHLEVVDTARCVKPVTFMSNMLCLGPEKKCGWSKKLTKVWNSFQDVGLGVAFLFFYYFHPMQTGKKT